jgi:hypothetical protein
VRATPPSATGLMLVLGVGLISLATLIAIAVLVSRSQG